MHGRPTSHGVVAVAVGWLVGGKCAKTHIEVLRYFRLVSLPLSYTYNYRKRFKAYGDVGTRVPSKLHWLGNWQIEDCPWE